MFHERYYLYGSKWIKCRGHGIEMKGDEVTRAAGGGRSGDRDYTAAEFRLET
jgi:hypothetical protein